MKKLLTLSFALLITAGHAQAQMLDTETEDLINSLDSWVQEAEATPAKTKRSTTVSSFNRSRWAQRQATYRSLTGRSSSMSESNYASRTPFSMRKSRQTRGDQARSTQRPTRTTSLSNFGATSAKARLLQRGKSERSQLKPNRWLINRNARASSQTQAPSPLDTILGELEADFNLDFEIEQ